MGTPNGQPRQQAIEPLHALESSGIQCERREDGRLEVDTRDIRLSIQAALAESEHELDRVLQGLREPDKLVEIFTFLTREEAAELIETIKANDSAHKMEHQDKLAQVLAKCEAIARICGLKSLTRDRMVKAPSREEIAANTETAEKPESIASIELVERSDIDIEDQAAIKAIDELYNLATNTVLNVHSLNRKDGQGDELAVLTSAEQNAYTGLPIQNLATLAILVCAKQAKKGKLNLKGPAARYPMIRWERDTAEVLADIEIDTTSPDSAIITDNSTIAQGVEETGLHTGPNAGQPFAVLGNLAVYREKAGEDPQNNVFRVSGKNISSADITEMARNLGFKGPLAIRLVTTKNCTLKTKAIHSHPRKDVEVGTMVANHMSDPEISGEIVEGTGIVTNTPYTKNGHIHTDKGHLVSVSGTIYLEISAANAFYGPYEPGNPRERRFTTCWHGT
jgi:hypothetical protein